MSDLPATISRLRDASSRCASAVELEIAHASDDALLGVQTELAAARRFVDAAAAVVAAEVARRSRRELGYTGLAQRKGARTPELLIQTITGSTAADARQLVRVGTMMADAIVHRRDPMTPVAQPWLAVVAAALSAGAVSASAADAIREGLGKPADDVTAESLALAATRLVAQSATVTVERLAMLARAARDELDCAGVALRESQRRERRYLRLVPLSDGMTRITGLLDPESAAVISSAVDAATSPRRGGPRFVDPRLMADAKRMIEDDRSTEQIALDALVELVDVAVRSRNSAVLAARRPDVRVIVTQGDLDRRAGVGFIEGQTASVSIETVERAACDGGLVPILFYDDGSALNLGRSQRLHNSRQRRVIAVRDGGCLAPGCERPPSWCEVHHITEYAAGGKTDLADGILLCRHHHLLVHNLGWKVTRDARGYLLGAPPGAGREEIRLHSKSPAIERMLATA